MMRSRHLFLRIAAATVLASGVALPVTASAQSGGATPADFPNLVPVVVWTAVFAVLALLLTSVGYLYRRQHGMDHPLHAPPIGAEDEHGHGASDPLVPTAGHEVTPHERFEHAGSGASDAIEQAAVAHDAGR
ncbi:MAG: hypothetical protein ACYDCQ_07430 [Dehalococcoidia bacterium]